ncbi:methyltransferase CmcJ [Colletotrichum nymphaeae SA-01]|uniref:Methyltransferase CmcJ n=1 Tax=Colletotrichum nymphaeae SA-01 TaxID=1460502 RepID=A0A135TRW6_9PEZI|nr:methyltransferase CmcJ [Colletotrichum nymphaeae SA-01]
MALPSPSCLTAQLHFLARNPKYEHEKPYTLRYTPSPEDGLSQSNIDRVQHEVKFHDLRLRSLDYSECGFTVTDCSSILQYDDYADTDKIEKAHAPEVMVAVRLALGATSVDLLDYVWLTSVWHPLRGPLVDWPLALCDAQTVDFARDTMAGDVVDRDNVFENTQVHFNEGQRWFYLSNQLPTELLIFKNADSQEPLGATPGVPHASFDNPITSEEDFRRESIEMRVLVQWD